MPDCLSFDIRPLNDLNQCIQLISDVTSESPERVARRLHEEHESLGTNVRKALLARGVTFHLPSADLDDFYSTTDAFLYETLVWNRLPEKQRLRKRAVAAITAFGKRGSAILVYGDGLGFDCVALAQAGHEVTYFDVGTASRAFAERIFSINKVTVNKSTSLGDYRPQTFDAVVCLDVLEHVVEPAALVKDLTDLLKPHGLFVCHAPFAFISDAVGTHLRANTRFSGTWRGVYGQAGLAPVDGEPFWNPIILEKTAGGTTAHRFRVSRYVPWMIGGMVLRLSGFWPVPYSWLCQTNAARNCRLVRESMTPKPPI